MSNPASNYLNPADDSGALAATEQLQLLIRDGHERAVETVLSAHPQLADDRDALLELIYLEFVLRQETMRPVDEASLCGRFPELAQDIRMLMEVDAAVHWSPSHATKAELSIGHPAMDTPQSFLPAEETPHSLIRQASAIEGGFEDYQILDKIGQGGMGLVYRAHQHSLNRLVAIKTINVASSFHPSLRARFQAEAELSAKLQHRNIVQIYSIGESDGVPYFSMELVNGPNLADAIAERPLDPHPAAQLVATLARAIHYAHNQGIIHRDLKPTNILLAPNDQQSKLDDLSHYEPKIADFGLARFSQATTQQTRSGAMLGTPSYMSPEQITDQDQVGPASDIYALGAILYTLLVGQPPFHAASTLETLRQVRQDDPVPLRRINSRLPRDLETICLKCLRKEPQARYESAEHLAVDLNQFLLNKPIAARPTGVIERTWKWTRRHPSLATLIVALCCSSIIMTGLWWQAKASQLSEYRQRSRAERLNADRDLQHAQREYEAFNIDGCKQLLAACEPSFRHWEWHYLNGLCNQALWESPRHAQSALTTDISHDGSLVAIGYGRWGYDAPQEIQVWDLQNQQLKFGLKGHPDSAVSDVNFSPDGKYLLSAATAWNSAEDAEFGGVILWDLETGKPRLRSSKVNAQVARFHRDGQSFFVGSTQGAVTQHAIADGKLICTYRARERAQMNTMVLDMAFDFDSKRLAATSRGGELGIWNLDQSEPAYYLTDLGDPRQVELTPDGEQVIVGTYSGGREWYKLQPDRLQSVHRDAVGAVPYMIYSPDGLRQVVSIYGGGVEVRDTHSGKLIRTLRGHLGHVRDMAFDGSGTRLVTCGQDGRTVLWDVTEEERYPKRVALVGKVGFMASCPTADEAALTIQENPSRGARSSGQPRIEIRRPADLKLVNTLKLPAVANCLAYSSDGTDIIVGLSDNTAQVWHKTAKEPLCTFVSHQSRIIDVVFEDKGDHAISLDQSGSLSKWNRTDGQLVQQQQLNSGVVLADFHPTSPLLAFTNEQDEVRLWNHRLQQPVAQLANMTKIRYLAFSSDGRLLGIAFDKIENGNQQSTIHLYETATLATGQPSAPVAQLNGHLGTVTGFSFSSDNQRLVTISDDETVRLFDVALSCEVHLLDTEKGNDGTVLFGYGGHHILRSRSSELASWGNQWPLDKLQIETETERADRLKKWHTATMSQAYRGQKWKAARFHASALLELGDTKQLYQRGLFYSFDGLWEAAEQDLQAFLKETDSLAARCQLARVLLKQNKLEEYHALCMQLCDQLDDALPAEDVNRIAWIVCLRPDDRVPYASLIEHLNRAIKKQNKSTYHNTLALVQYRAGHYDDAIAAAKRSLKLDQAASAPFDWLILDLCYAQQQRQQDPAALAKVAIQDLVNAANTLRGKKTNAAYRKQAVAWIKREEQKAAQKKPLSMAYLQTQSMELAWLMQELDELSE